jgi:hypothetical protein
MFEAKRSTYGVSVSRPIVAGAAMLVLLSAAGCESDFFQSRYFVGPPYLPSSHGDAIAHNHAVHVVNPNPPAHQHPPNLNGLRAGVAIGRYQSNKAITPSAPGVTGGSN